MTKISRVIGMLAVGGFFGGLLGTSCSSSGPNNAASGGTTGSSGGTTSSGGTKGSGGTTGSGGATGSGGTVSSGGSSGSGGASGASWALTSPDFTSDSALPYQFTCNGHDFASGDFPELDWTSGPAGTKSYAVVLTDNSVLDQGISSGDGTTLNHAFHWVIWNIPATVHQLPHSLGTDDNQDPSEVSGAHQWANRNQFGFFPPCPNSSPGTDAAIADDHYSFHLYALDVDAVDCPAYNPAITTNFTRTIFSYLEAHNIGEVTLPFTSDAQSGSPPAAAAAPTGPTSCPAAGTAGSNGSAGSNGAGGNGGASGGAGGSAGSSGAAGHGGTPGHGGAGGHGGSN